MENIAILIIDDDLSSQAALSQVLGAEGWLVETAESANKAFRELAAGKWSLVLANVATTGVSGPLFTILRELAQPPESTAAKAHVRVLFIVPETNASNAVSLLEEDHLSYLLKPFNFHDLLERVSDLLMETEAIGAPIRRVRQEGLMSPKARRAAQARQDTGRNTGMFARQEDYQWSEEELAEYERQEVEAQKKKKKKPMTLG